MGINCLATWLHHHDLAIWLRCIIQHHHLPQYRRRRRGLDVKTAWA